MSPIGALLATAVCASGGTFAWAATVPSAQLFGRTLRRTGDPGTIALTFDDGPNPAVTPSLLDLLEKHRVRATFFVIGRYARAERGLAREIADRGHSVGNHTETHPSLTFLSPARIAAELNACGQAVREATGRAAECMRPPFGFRGPQLSSVAQRCGLGCTVMWSFSGQDWKMKSAEALQRHLAGVRGGDIVLLHDGDDTHPEGDRRNTVDALAYWLPRWIDAGFRFVNMDDLQPVVAS